MQHVNKSENGVSKKRTVSELTKELDQAKLLVQELEKECEKRAQEYNSLLVQNKLPSDNETQQSAVSISASKELENIIERLRETIECPICLENKSQGNQVLNCGHFACGACLREWETREKKQCPTCNTVITVPYTSYVLDHISEILAKHFPHQAATSSMSPQVASQVSKLRTRRKVENMIAQTAISMRPKRQRKPSSTICDIVI